MLNVYTTGLIIRQHSILFNTCICTFSSAWAAYVIVANSMDPGLAVLVQSDQGLYYIGEVKTIF